MGFIKNLISKLRGNKPEAVDLSIPYELFEDGVSSVMNYNGALFTSTDDGIMWQYEGNRDNTPLDRELFTRGLMTMQDIQRYFIVKNFVHQAGKI